ncbi:alanine dehydrogenase [Cardiosporidium cionae]|uniref:alanine dehydrogenase n=1 Tax=Cardiosporidium cionae TaxID=476202 RepID=A0ABQ7JEJ4_9APIC|nr:alanine dehydrogenase [Cardiosporidium cionae]|eukprot:KAF8822070.1 alanine dehydrogenase [Cardiosporidium cionae]
MGLPSIKVVGVPKEIKNHEYRVGLTPASAMEYVRCDTVVLIETQAGLGSGFADADYISAGCHIRATAREIYDEAEMIIKVKEPQEEEYDLIREHQIIFTYFHFAANRALTEAMICRKCICISYETVEAEDRSLPLLIPMSEIAGKMAIHQAAKYLEKPSGGSGILLSGVPGVASAKVLILGGGIVGKNSARVAAGMGASVTILDVNPAVLRRLDTELPSNCKTLFSNRENILQELLVSDVVIGAVLISGAAAPLLISRQDIAIMKRGSVIIDVAVDQGGCIETCKPTTHDDPTYVVDGILHYCVSNMPGAVPNTATIALNNATLRYGLAIVRHGWKVACKTIPSLTKGVSIVEGNITCKAVSVAFDLPYEDLQIYSKSLI